MHDVREEDARVRISNDHFPPRIRDVVVCSKIDILPRELWKTSSRKWNEVPARNFSLPSPLRDVDKSAVRIGTDWITGEWDRNGTH